MHDYVIKVNHPPVNAGDVFTKTLQESIKDHGLVSGDRIRLGLNHESWAKPISTKLTRIPNGDLSEYLAGLIKKMLEFAEYKSAALNELTISVHSVKMPRGSGRLKTTRQNIHLKKSVIVVKNNDTMCMARAIVTAYANKLGTKPSDGTKLTKSQIKNGFNASRPLQTEEAELLHENADVEVNEFGNTLDDALRFANHLKVQVNIVDNDNFNSLVFSDGPKGGVPLYILKQGNHFDTITSMPALLCKYYYFDTCKKSYKKRDYHKCPSKCTACFKSNSGCKDNTKSSMITCQVCNRDIYGQKCYDEHRRNRATKPGCVDIVCAIVQKCLSCKRTVKDLEKHVCGYVKCGNCDEYSPRETHKCHMTRWECKGGECTRMKMTKDEYGRPIEECCLEQGLTTELYN